MPRRSRLLLAGLCAVVLAGGCESRGAPTSPGGAPTSRIVVLGDSLAVSPIPGQAFPAVLQARLTAEGLPWTVRNASGLGDTTADGRARLDAALALEPSILILELGGNDGLRGIEVTTVKSNLADIIARAKARHVRVLLCGMETLPLHGLSYALEFHDIYPALAREHDVPLVPFLLAGVVGNPELNLDDLIHPNAAGARRIVENIWPLLEPMVRQQVSLWRPDLQVRQQLRKESS